MVSRFESTFPGLTKAHMEYHRRIVKEASDATRVKAVTQMVLRQFPKPLPIDKWRLQNKAPPNRLSDLVYAIATYPLWPDKYDEKDLVNMGADSFARTGKNFTGTDFWDVVDLIGRVITMVKGPPRDVPARDIYPRSPIALPPRDVDLTLGGRLLPNRPTPPTQMTKELILEYKKFVDATWKLISDTGKLNDEFKRMPSRAMTIQDWRALIRAEPTEPHHVVYAIAMYPLWPNRYDEKDLVFMGSLKFLRAGKSRLFWDAVKIIAPRMKRVRFQEPWMEDVRRR